MTTQEAKVISDLLYFVKEPDLTWLGDLLYTDKELTQIEKEKLVVLQEKHLSGGYGRE